MRIVLKLLPIVFLVLSCQKEPVDNQSIMIKAAEIIELEEMIGATFTLIPSSEYENIDMTKVMTTDELKSHINKKCRQTRTLNAPFSVDCTVKINGWMKWAGTSYIQDYNNYFEMKIGEAGYTAVSGFISGYGNVYISDRPPMSHYICDNSEHHCRNKFRINNNLDQSFNTATEIYKFLDIHFSSYIGYSSAGRTYIINCEDTREQQYFIKDDKGKNVYRLTEVIMLEGQCYIDNCQNTNEGSILTGGGPMRISISYYYYS